MSLPVSVSAAQQPPGQEYRQRIANVSFPASGISGERRLPIFAADRFGHSPDLDFSR